MYNCTLWALVLKNKESLSSDSLDCQKYIKLNWEGGLYICVMVVLQDFGPYAHMTHNPLRLLYKYNQVIYIMEAYKCHQQRDATDTANCCFSILVFFL